MLADRYNLALTTASQAARDAYIEAADLLLSVFPGAIDVFERAIAHDPSFALAHCGKAQMLLSGGNLKPALESLAMARSVAAAVTDREASHIAFFELLASGDSEAALAALLVHLQKWPRDALALTPTAFTNGLIGSSGRADAKRGMIELLDRLAPHYGDNWWFLAHHGMALSEVGRYDAAHAKIDASLARNANNGWVAHAHTHLCYETGDPGSARGFLAPWLARYPRNAPLYSHLNWHLALGDLAAGDAAEASRLYRETFSLDVHSGPPRAKVTDGVSFLWRRELAGHPRDGGAWRAIYEFAGAHLPRAGAALADAHVVLTQIVAGDDMALAARAAQIEALARDGRYPSGDFVPTLSRAFAAFERGDFAAAIDGLEPMIGDCERIGGSRAQLDLVVFTLLKAYLGAGRPDEARKLLQARLPGALGVPVAGAHLLH